MSEVSDIFSLASYDYMLPSERIAQHPVHPRDSSKLLVVGRDGELIEEHFFSVTKHLLPGDLLVVNDTRVFPARLLGRRETGGAVELLLLENISQNRWKVLVRPGRRIRRGMVIKFGDELSAVIEEKLTDGTRIAKFPISGEEFWLVLDEVGHTPLPHYIRRDDKPSDRERYQTVYARERGAVAAPTAGLHFTEKLLNKIKNMGVELVPITLHIGWGTFKPIEVGDIREHKMHREFYSISKNAAQKLNAALNDGRRIIAVGTTTTRALESAAKSSTLINPHSRWTDLYIYPGYKFKVVDAMITNFHLPRSSLLVMVSAFAGIERIMRAYQYALSHNFRFYSYGDAMMIFRSERH